VSGATLKSVKECRDVGIVLTQNGSLKTQLAKLCY